MGRWLIGSLASSLTHLLSEAAAHGAFIMPAAGGWEAREGRPQTRLERDHGAILNLSVWAVAPPRGRGGERQSCNSQLPVGEAQSPSLPMADGRCPKADEERTVFMARLGGGASTRLVCSNVIKWLTATMEGTRLAAVVLPGNPAQRAHSQLPSRAGWVVAPLEGFAAKAQQASGPACWDLCVIPMDR